MEVQFVVGITNKTQYFFKANELVSSVVQATWSSLHIIDCNDTNLSVACMILPTCDDEAFIVFQCFGEEAGNDEFSVDEEPYLFLDQPMSCDTSTYESVCKVHLVIKTKETEDFTKEAQSLKSPWDMVVSLFYVLLRDEMSQTQDTIVEINNVRMEWTKHILIKKNMNILYYPLFCPFNAVRLNCEVWILWRAVIWINDYSCLLITCHPLTSFNTDKCQRIIASLPAWK